MSGQCRSLSSRRSGSGRIVLDLLTESEVAKEADPLEYDWRVLDLLLVQVIIDGESMRRYN